MRDSLFVYGSFSEGMVHFSKIKGQIVERRPAFAFGSVYRLPVGYPVFIQEGVGRIEGEFVRLERPEIIFAMLDEMHGVCAYDPEKSLFNRVELTVEVEFSGLNEGEKAWVYCFNPMKLTRGAVRIVDGNWKRALQESPPIVAKLTEKQRTYIQRLGSSTGREIVPIDLGLYRELLNLEMVVDKGRRLALTSLGQEVYRYL